MDIASIALAGQIYMMKRSAAFKVHRIVQLSRCPSLRISEGRGSRNRRNAFKLQR